MAAVLYGRSDGRFMKIKLDLRDERDRLIQLYILALEFQTKELEPSAFRLKSSTPYPHSTLPLSPDSNAIAKSTSHA